MKDLKDCTVSISKSSRGYVSIYLKDTKSRTRFVSVEMSQEEFANALFGLADCDASYSVVGLDNLGKDRVNERRSVLYTGEPTHDRDRLSRWIDDNCQEEGWLVSNYLGSQGSVERVNGSVYLHYSVVKYV